MRADWAALIRQLAPRYRVDPKAALAVASMEGLSGRVGDGGHAFGPFQLNDAGGVLTNRPGNHQAFAESPQGIAWALQQIGKVAGGETGAQAVNDIVRRFERPAAPNPEVSGALANYGNVGGGGRVPAQVLSAALAGGGSNQLPAAGGIMQNPDLFKQLLGQQLLQNSQQAMSGNIAGAGNGLLQMVAMRNALQTASASGMSDASAPAASHAATHGAGTLNAPVKTLDGSYQMQVGGRSPYSNLRFDGGTDWMHVNPRLLKTINTVAATHGTVIDINSGYRSNQHSLQVGGFAGDPHTKGIAIDGYINGKPVGSVIPAGTWTKYGIQSGNVPNFYNGKPDPEHLQLGA